MQIFVRSPVSSKTIVLSCEPSTTISELKQQLWEREGIPVERFCFFYGAQKLINEMMTVNEAGIQNETSLAVHCRANQDFTVNIKPIYFNQTYQVSVSEEMLVEDLKEKISEKDGHPSESLRLVYKGKLLTNEYSLKEYGIKATETLYLLREAKKCSCPCEDELSVKRRKVIGGCVFDPSGNEISRSKCV